MFEKVALVSDGTALRGRRGCAGRETSRIHGRISCIDVQGKLHPTRAGVRERRVVGEGRLRRCGCGEDARLSAVGPGERGCGGPGRPHGVGGLPGRAAIGAAGPKLPCREKCGGAQLAPSVDQTSILVRMRSITASVNSVVPAWPPRSGVLIPPAIASSTDS